MRQPEDGDGYLDEDGCPEPPELIIRVVDETGLPLTGVNAALVGDRYELPFTEDARFELEPGAYTMAAHADGYHDALNAVTVTEGPPRTVELILRPVRVVVSRERFDLDDDIYFASGSDQILEGSWPLLEEVARALASTPEIQRLRIEGHTDSVGLPDDNLELSQRRADAVRAFLIARGVAADRIVAVGFGESKPVVGVGDEAASATNRRVEFLVDRWDPDAGR